MRVPEAYRERRAQAAVEAGQAQDKLHAVVLTTNVDLALERAFPEEGVGVAHLGSELKPGWLALPVIGSDYARRFDFSDWQSEFVETICDGGMVDGCSEDRNH